MVDPALGDGTRVLSERLGHVFADPETLLLALTHRSWCAENAGFVPVEKYSAPMPRTMPVISRPPVMQSIMACSSAMFSGCWRRQKALPRIAILVFLVRRDSAAAVTTGEGIRP